MRSPNFFGKKSAVLCGHIRSDEAQASADLHRESFAHPWPVQEFEVILSARETVADGLLDSSGKLQGMAITRVIGSEGEILTIAVGKRYRSQGNGALLMEYHLTHLTSLGVARLFLEVSDENLPAKKLYEKFSFKQVGERRGYYKNADGSRLDALILAVDL